jgi:hypothetical protein
MKKKKHNCGKKRRRKQAPLVLNDRDSRTHVLGASAATYMAYMDHLT